jgi:hypothetical protein
MTPGDGRKRYILDGHAGRVTVHPEDGEPYNLWQSHFSKYRAPHSPTGFAWGYLGSGPSELARAILSDFLGREAQPGEYQPFKEAAIAVVPGPSGGGEIELYHTDDERGYGWTLRLADDTPQRRRPPAPDYSVEEALERKHGLLPSSREALIEDEADDYYGIGSAERYRVDKRNH